MSKELNLDNYEEVAFETLKHRAKRLVRLIEIGAPGRVIGAEIELVRSAGIGLYRTEYFAMAAIRQASMEQQMLGFCPMCDGEPKRPRPGKTVCDACEEERRKELDELDKSLYPT